MQHAHRLHTTTLNCPPNQVVRSQTTTPTPQTNSCYSTPQPYPPNQLEHALVSSADCIHTGPTPQPLSPKLTLSAPHQIPYPPDQLVLPHITTPIHQTNSCIPTCPTLTITCTSAPHNPCPPNAECINHIGRTPQFLPPKPTRATPHHNPYPPHQPMLPHTPQPLSTKPTRATLHHNPYLSNQLVLLHTTTPIHQTSTGYSTPQTLSTKLARATPHHNPYPPNQLVLLYTTTPIHQTNSCYSTPQPLSTKPTHAVPHTTTPIHQTNSCYSTHHNRYPPNQLVLLYTTTPIYQTNSCYSTPETLSTKPTRATPHQKPYPPN